MHGKYRKDVSRVVEGEGADSCSRGTNARQLRMLLHNRHTHTQLH